jgi:ubiquinone/menaquinone biosynthesis C-methylase UbiE
MQANFSQYAGQYERMSGGVTRKIGEEVLKLIPPIMPSSVVHDNACGPGIMTSIILEQAAGAGQPPPKIIATDFAEGMINTLKQGIEANGWNTVNAKVMDAGDLSAIPSESITHSITNFGLFAVPDAVKGAAEIKRTLKPGGYAIITTWKVASSLELIWRVQKAIRPDLPLFEPVSRDWLHEWKIRGVVLDGGFKESNVKIVPIETWWEGGTDELVTVMSGPFWDVVKAEWTDKEQERWPEEVRNQLTEEERRDGRLRMVAWVCVAKKEE